MDSRLHIESDDLAGPQGLDTQELHWLRASIEASGYVAFNRDLAENRIALSAESNDIFGCTTDRFFIECDEFELRIHAEDVHLRRRILNKCLESGTPYVAEYRFQREDGGQVWICERGRFDLDVAGKPVGLMGTFQTINEWKKRESLLEYRATYDDLTGNLNRFRLREALDHVIANAIRYGTPGGYLLIGIDNLAAINKTYGFDISDQMIVAISDRLRSCIRSSDMVGRMSGNKFGVVLSRCEPADLPGAADKILAVVNSRFADTASGPIPVTVSVGGVSLPGQANTSEEAMTYAEEMLQHAKLNGRDCFANYSESEIRRNARETNSLVAEKVVAALRDDRLVLAYQPIVNAASGEVEHYECLMRLQEENGDVLAAGAFIPVAEELGLVRLLDQRTAELAIQTLEKMPDINLAVNVSGVSAMDRAWMRKIMERISNRRDIASRLIFEITETEAVLDIADSIRFVESLHEIGSRIALDDFGAGYTSFRHLKALDVDEVKIDGSFIRDMESQPENLLFVRTLIDLANAFDIRTVAECVETEEVGKILFREGVHALQGYHFGKPDISPQWLNGTAEKAGLSC